MRRYVVLTIAASAFLCACQNGTVTLSVADAPIDGASSVQIEFTGAELIETDGSSHSFDFNPPISPNLLASTATQLLTNVTVPAGDYKQITLHINADGSSGHSLVIYPTSSTISRTGSQPLELSDSQQADGVELPAIFSVTRLRNTALTADFDLRKSILEPGDATRPLELDPQIRVVKDDDIGALNGTVAASLVASGTSCNPAAIYVYQGAGVTPGDEGGSGSQPFTSTTLASGGTSTTGFVSYTVGYLSPGTYTVALICDPELDDPSAANDVDFSNAPRQNVSISAGVTTTAVAFQ